MMRRLFLAISLLVLSTGAWIAHAGGTKGHAIPFDFQLTTDSVFIHTVFVQVTAGWLNAPHSVEVTITSVNGDPLDVFFHGQQVEVLADLEVIGDTLLGTAVVAVPWFDQHARENHSTYTICSRLIFADHPGEEICETLL